MVSTWRKLVVAALFSTLPTTALVAEEYAGESTILTEPMGRFAPSSTQSSYWNGDLYQSVVPATGMMPMTPEGSYLQPSVANGGIEQVACGKVPGGCGCEGGPTQPFFPKDVYGNQMGMPTPTSQADYNGPLYCQNDGRPDNRAGIRLDKAYGLIRDTEFNFYGSEQQYATAAGGTILPYQSPCLMVGWRGLGVWWDNNGNFRDLSGFSSDLFVGTRYKGFYSKVGGFWDWMDEFQKGGLEYSCLTDLGPIRNVTCDFAVGWSNQTDQYTSAFGNIPSRFQRIQMPDEDYQLRIGKYFTTYCQAGYSGSYFTYRNTEDENYHGAFANFYVWRMLLSLDLRGGTQGLRGFASIGLNWGAKYSCRPIDCNHGGVDTLTWLSAPTVRDISIPLRSSFTGPLVP